MTTSDQTPDLAGVSISRGVGEGRLHRAGPGWPRRTSRRSGAWLLVALGFVALGFVSPLAALNPDRKPDSYSIQGWFTEQGLPSNKVRAVAQTRDGYLWLATAQGIARFDGSRFTVFNGASHPELRGGGFYAVQEAPDGALWFGGDNGLFRWREGRFDRFTTAQGLAHNYVRALALTRDGAIVACTGAGYSVMRAGRLVTPAGVWKTIAGIARSYLERADGSTLLGTEEGLWRISGETIVRLSGAGGLPGVGFNSLLETADGTLWIGHSRGVRSQRADGTTEDYGAAQGLVTPRTAALRFDREGNLWIAGYGGLARLTRGRIEPVTYGGQLAGTTIQQFCEEREGGLWIATATGLYRLKDNVSGSIGVAEGLAQTSAYTVLEARDGAWWIGLWGGGVYRYDQTRATRLNVPAALRLDQILALAEEPAGTLWIGSYAGLYRHRDGTTVNLYDRDRAAAWQKQLAERPGTGVPGIAHAHVNSIAADGAGGLWVATDGALYHGREGDFHATTPADGLPGHVFKSVVRARNGNIWTTVPPFGVARLHDGRWTNYRCGRELSDVAPRGIYEDTAGDIWVTTEGGGLNRFKDGKWRTFTRRDGLADDFISGLTEDTLGNLWIASPRGVMRLPRAEFDELDAGRRAALEPRNFNRFDGLPAGETNQQGSPNAGRTRDGRLLFATDRGVAVVEPDGIKINSLKPPVYVERLVVNGADADLARPVSVAPGVNAVQIYYTALSLIAPEKVRFKIRLAPLDRDWVDAGNRREVRYDKLPPGDYSFAVIACNNDGVWNEEGAAVAFAVRPYFYQTGWFRGLVVAAAVGGALGLYLARVRQARRQLAVLASLVEERTRELKAAKESAEAAVSAKSEVIVALQNAEERVARERERFRFIFESLPVGVTWMHGGQLETRIVNPAYARITGIPVEQRHELDFYRLATAPGDREHEELLHRQLVAGLLDHYTLEKHCIHPDGSVRAVALAVRFFRDPVSGATQEIGTVTDITERKRAEAERENSLSVLHATLESTADGILAVTLAGEVVCSNTQFAVMWGVPPALLAGKDAERLAAFVADRVTNPEQFLRRTGELLAAPETEAFDVLELRDGRTFERYVKTQRVAGRVVGLVANFRDITARRRADSELTALHRQLLTTSRQAGMAEVATGVLHNVGNVLNSVNVSATLIADQVRHSKAGNVAKLAAMFGEHRADLAAFLTLDPRGRMIPDYLGTLRDALAAEQKATTAELDHLRKNIEHIKDVVAMQQNYATTSGFTEMVPLVELTEDALQMSASSLARHEVELVREFQPIPAVATDKHKVMQILVNLVTNAKYACETSGRTDKRIVVRIGGDARAVRISVGDNGVGIPAENLTRIFNHGFTTKKDGHGFGLHSGANAAKELGGSLTVQSDGPGRGATFTLELPCHPGAATS